MRRISSDNVRSPLPADDDAGYPRRSYAWAVVAILIGTAILSYTDRQVLSLLVDPIRRDLLISDTEVSLLLGTAFAVVYAIAGIPFGLLAGPPMVARNPGYPGAGAASRHRTGCIRCRRCIGSARCSVARCADLPRRGDGIARRQRRRRLGADAADPRLWPRCGSSRLAARVAADNRLRGRRPARGLALGPARPRRALVAQTERLPGLEPRHHVGVLGHRCRAGQGRHGCRATLLRPVGNRHGLRLLLDTGRGAEPAPRLRDGGEFLPECRARRGTRPYLRGVGQ